MVLQLFAEVNREGLVISAKTTTRELLLAAVERDPEALLELAKKYRADRDFVTAAVQHRGMLLQRASAELKNDRVVVLAAVKDNGMALEQASAVLLDDREVVLAAVNQDGGALEFASDAFRSDPTFYMPAIRCEGSAIEFAPLEVRRDRSMMLCAVSAPHGDPENASALEIAEVQFQADRELVMAAVTNYGDVLKHASKALRADRAVVMAAVASSGYSIVSASEELKLDREVMLTAATQEGDMDFFSNCYDLDVDGPDDSNVPEERWKEIHVYVQASLRDLFIFKKTVLWGMLHATTQAPVFPRASRLRGSSGFRRRCLLPMLTRDEETTTALKKLIAEFLGVPHGPRVGLLRRALDNLEQAEFCAEKI
jgi:hypothetical protein